MEKIIFPLSFLSTGPEVSNLQEALLAISRQETDWNLKSLLAENMFRQTFEVERKEWSYGEATRQAVASFQENYMKVGSASESGALTGEIDEPTADALNTLLLKYAQIPAAVVTYSISGTCYDNLLQPLVHSTVRAFDQGMRKETLLGEAVTNDQGGYSISFGVAAFAKTGKQSPDVFVSLYARNGKAVKSSETYYNAPTSLTVDLNLAPVDYTGTSEFEVAEAAIQPLIGRISIANLTEDDKNKDISYLVNKTGLPTNQILMFVTAYRFEEWTKIAAAVWYGIMREQPVGTSDALATDVDAFSIDRYNSLLTLSSKKMVNVLQQAIDDNIVPYSLSANIKEVTAQWLELTATPILPPGEKAVNSPLYQQMKLAGLTVAQRQAVISSNPSTVADPDFWTSLGKQDAFATKPAMVEKLQAIVQLSAIVSGNTDLVAAVLQEQKIKTPDDIASLAGLDAATWKDYLGRNKGALPTDTTAAEYSVQLAYIFEKAFPMAAFSGAIDRNIAQQKPAATHWTSNISSFLSANPTFDFATDHVNLFLQQEKKMSSKAIDQQVLVTQLMGVQRLYKLAPSYTGVSRLVQDGVLSAQQIYGMGKSRFVAEYDGKLGRHPAADVFERAAIQYGGAITILGRLNGLRSFASVGEPESFSKEFARSPVAKAYPGLNSIFGLADYCECKDCRSFMSQSAYLTDIIEFLNQRKSGYTVGGLNYSAREILLANGTYPSGLPSRRPDLGDIDLNCENTNVQLPYIDLVNELLEDYIAPPEFVLPIGTLTAADFTPGPISTNLLNAILDIPVVGTPYNTAIYNIALLTKKAILSSPFRDVEFQYEQWIIRDRFITLKLSIQLRDGSTRSAKGNIGILVQELHETHLTADQIKASPEYVNTNVYDKLLKMTVAAYPNSIPFGLPFDLYFVTANTFLDKMGVHQFQLKQIFKKENLSPGDTLAERILVAATYFQLSFNEWTLIFLPTAFDHNQKRLWGTTIINQITSLGGPEVDTFLEYTGLDYEQLIGLLQLVSINGVDAAITPPTATMSQIYREDGPLSCDPSQMYITLVNNDSTVITNFAYEPPMASTAAVKLTRLDLMNRLLRLQPKTNLTLAELDASLQAPAIGRADIDAVFSIQLMYQQQLMTEFSLGAMPVLSFFQEIDTKGKNSLYQQLFQNLAISNPLNPALNIVNFDGTDIDDTTGAQGVMQIIITACRIKMVDLQILLSMIRGGIATAPAPIGLDTLSFIYRYGLLAGALNLSVEDLVTLIDLVGITPLLKYGAAAGSVKPEDTWNFVIKWKKLGKAGLSVDGLNFVLTNQSDATPSLIPDSATVTAGLTAVRSALQTVIAGTVVTPDPKGLLLTQWLSDPVLNWDKTIAAKLIKMLGTTDDQTYAELVVENGRFLQLLSLQYAQATTTVFLPALPAISFPDTSITGLSYDATTAYLGVTGVITTDQQAYLSSLSSTTAYQSAVGVLASLSQTQPYSVAPLATLPATAVFPDKNIPMVSYFTGSLSFKGPMSGPVYNALYGLTTDSDFRHAADLLFVYSQDFAAGAVITVPLENLPPIAFPDGTINSIGYSPAVAPAVGTLGYDGVMSLADYKALQGVSSDAGYLAALKQLFMAASGVGPASVPLAALPAWDFAFPDGNSANLSLSTPSTLAFTGVMSPADFTALLALSGDAFFQQALAELFVVSDAGTHSVSALPLLTGSFPLPDTKILSASFTNGQYLFTGSMSVPDLLVLLTLSADVKYKTAMCKLFSLSQDGVTVSVTPAAPAPAPVVFPDSSIAAATYDGTNLSITGIMSLATRNALQAVGFGGTFNTAVGNLYTASVGSLPSAVNSIPLSPPAFDFPDAQLATISVSTVGGVTTMSFTGTMSVADLQGLLALEPDPGYQQAVRFLFGLSQLSPVLNSTTFIPPASWAFTWPDSNIGNLGYENGQLQFTGRMSPTDLACLLKVKDDAGYRAAVKTLYAQSQINPLTNATPAAMPSIGLPDATLPTIEYQKGMLVCSATPTVADLNNFVQLNDDPEQEALFFFLHKSVLGVSATTLDALPPITIPTSIAGLTYADGMLQLVGKMKPADKSQLLALSANADFQDVINRLDANSQANSATTVNAISLPVLPIVSLTAVPAVSYANGILSVSAPLSSVDMGNLSGYSDYTDYQLAINELYTLSNYPWAATNISLMYPADLTPPDLSLLTAPVTVTYVDGSLFCPASPVSDADLYALCGLSGDSGYVSAVKDLYLKAVAVAAGTAISSVSFALPSITVPFIYGSQLTYDPTLQTLTLAGFIAAEDRLALLGLSEDTYYQVAIDALYDELTEAMTAADVSWQPFSLDVEGDLLDLTDGNAPDLMVPDRFGWALNLLQPVYLRLKEAAALSQQLVNLFQIKAPLAATLIGDETDFFFDRLTDTNFVQSARPINEIAYFDQFYIYYASARIAFLINQYKMSAEDLAWLLANSVSAGAFDLLAVPGDWTEFGGPSNATIGFAQWEVLNALYTFQRKYNATTIVDASAPGTKVPCSVFTIVQHATDIYQALNPAPGDPVMVIDPGALVDELMVLTKWAEEDIDDLLSLDGSALNPLNLPIDNEVLGSVISLSNPGLLNRLLHCVATAGQLGVPVARAFSWSSPEALVSYALADDIKQGLKNKSATPALWAKVIVPLENTLREKRRDAMLAYILANHAAIDKFTDEYDVYSKFLIDLEMTSCQPTTRMLQAYCSVQLFVFRCMMSLEPNVPVVTASTTAATPFDEDWSQWSWMDTYEKWRRNRMVFLYPENYIRPELLPGASSFYSDMLNSLTQSPATSELAETVLMNYTIGLDSIAKLQPKAQWYDDVTDTLHVFATTNGGPPVVWYYRRKDLIDNWSAWEKVDLDIPDGIAIPAIMSGRLFLFWPVFNKKSVDASSDSAASGDKRAASKYWEIQMAFSEYQNGQWSPKKVSADVINTMNISSGAYQQIFPDKSDFVFVAWQTSPGINVTIGCYWVNNNPAIDRNLWTSSATTWIKEGGGDAYYTDPFGDPSNADRAAHHLGRLARHVAQFVTCRDRPEGEFGVLHAGLLRIVAGAGLERQAQRHRRAGALAERRGQIECKVGQVGTCRPHPAAGRARRAH